MFQELLAIKARVQELEMEEESERLKEEERCDTVDMQLLTSSPQSGEAAHFSAAKQCFVVPCCRIAKYQLCVQEASEIVFLATCVALQPPGR